MENKCQSIDSAELESVIRLKEDICEALRRIRKKLCPYLEKARIIVSNTEK